MTVSATSNQLLIEILCEELPPINLKQNIGEAFAQAVAAQLASFLTSNSQVKPIVSPRRFGVLISEILAEQPAVMHKRKGPAISSGLVDGVATPALLGFARSCACDWQQLTQANDGYFYYSAEVAGKLLSAVIGEVIQAALKKIQISKAMRWGDTDHLFVRPVHNLVVMLNDQVLDCQILGLTATNTSLGHRFMAPGPLTFSHAGNYFNEIYAQGKVIADFEQRQQLISQQLQAKAAELGLQISPLPGLLEEVTALVEWPVVLVGEFAAKFLQVPQECLILSMAKNQKYFALLDNDAKLANRFLFVANLESTNPQLVINGNQKVLSARLSDAEFFFEFDKKTRLADLVSKLGQVVYHNQLGTQLERCQRLQVISAKLAPLFGVDPKEAEQCASLLKADLVTEMVGEFPELQGVMGKYYALAAQESTAVATAIEQHYYPRFSGDSLPSTPLAQVMAVADRLESLVGMWGIGLIPTGDKDPYALRRAALGIVRILLVVDVDLKELLEITQSAFVGKQFAAATVSQVYEFIMQRLANYLTQVENLPTKVVAAALSCRRLAFAEPGCKSVAYLPSLLAILQQFAAHSHNQSLFAANKRIANILKKNEDELVVAPINPELLTASAERELYNLAKQQLAADKIEHLISACHWQEYFNLLAEFNEPLAQFFEQVMVMDENLAIRANRLNVLAFVQEAFNAVANLAELG